ncbi:MAG: carboxypeptidase regulatory-like domain-containing protein, partial [Phycisphaerales bacterium]|nr:carboxypeptidase regulatory-like domain-containing protein [Phycisphaerales bacterium]
PGGDGFNEYTYNNIDWDQSDWNWQISPDDGVSFYLGTTWNAQNKAYMAGYYQTLPASVSVFVDDLGLPDAPVQYGAQFADVLYAASSDGTQGPDFNLSAGATLRGRIITEDGDPVFMSNSRAPLRLQVQTANGMLTEFERTIDVNGNWEIQNVPAGEDVTLVTHEWDWGDYDINGVKYAWGERWVDTYTLAPGQVLNVGTLVVSRAACISGKVTDSTGQPIAGAEMSIVGLTDAGGEIDIESNVFTDESGRYRVDWITPGQISLGVRANGQFEYIYESIVLQSGDEIVHDVQMTPIDSVGGSIIVSGQVVNYNDIAPKNDMGNILPWGIMEDSYGDVNLPDWVTAVAFETGFDFTPESWLARVVQPTGFGHIEDGYDDYFVADPNPAGSFEMTLPAVPQSIFAVWDGREYYGAECAVFSDALEIDGTPGGVASGVEISFPIGTAEISGDFILPGDFTPGLNSPESAAAILCKSGGVDADQWRAAAEVNSQGGYLMGNIPAGTYYIAGVARGLETFYSQEFTVTAGQQIVQHIDLTLTPAPAPTPGAMSGEYASAIEPAGDNDEPLAAAPSPASAPIDDLLDVGEYPHQYQSTSPPVATQFAATGQYDLRPLSDDPIDGDSSDDLLVDILAEAALVVAL